jgi:hypothetical protein
MQPTIPTNKSTEQFVISDALANLTYLSTDRQYTIEEIYERLPCASRNIRAVTQTLERHTCTVMLCGKPLLKLMGVFDDLEEANLHVNAIIDMLYRNHDIEYASC